jgi:hypothetical protein
MAARGNLVWSNTTGMPEVQQAADNIILPNVADPGGTPAASTTYLYPVTHTEKTFMKWKDSSGSENFLGAHEAFHRCFYLMPGTTTSVITMGNTPFTTGGTLTTPAIAATNILTQTRRTSYSTGASAGTVAHVRMGQTEFWRGNSGSLGGFFVSFRFAVSALQTGNRAFVGISDVVTAPTNVDPTTSTTPGKVGMAFNASTGNWQFVNNVTGSAPTVLDLGANFALSVTAFLELSIFCTSQGNLNYRCYNIGTGSIATGTLSTNIPTTATFLTVVAWICNNATAAASILDISKVYVETKY